MRLRQRRIKKFKLYRAGSIVSAEDAKKPLSDSQISNILSQQGIVVARRTIAKYRESLQIPPVSLRKSI
ncbi:sigma-54-like protein [Sulfurirhabdus autotrophica]|uniref:Sigma-54-like protein n=1 Tax=Sulfurirhabdus autotrophica TaxID=1706046 RepID=A0A4R3XQ65_9PROT|nr:sigma-54-like protein [Sulfurirhabdus autotrophica]